MSSMQSRSQGNSGIINTGTIGGDASVRHVRRRIGDSVRADHSVVNVKSRAGEIQQRMEAARGLAPDQLAELRATIESVLKSVSQLPAEHAADRDRILDAVDTLSKEIARPDSPPGFLRKTAKLLQDALASVAGALPDAAALIKAVVKVTAFFV